MTPPAKILIVDDEPHVRAFFSKLVRVNFGGPVVVEAADAAGAVALYASEQPDLVLLDINLIGPSGLVALKQIRELDPAAAVVMLTAVSVRHTVADAAKLGASGYILKDTPHEEIVECLRGLVQEIFGEETSPQ